MCKNFSLENSVLGCGLVIVDLVRKMLIFLIFDGTLVFESNYLRLAVCQESHEVWRNAGIYYLKLYKDIRHDTIKNISKELK